MSGHGVGRGGFVQASHGDTQSPIGTLVLQYRRTVSGQVVQYLAVVGNIELLEVAAVGVELLQEDEQIHVVPAVGFDPEPHFRVADELGFGVEADGERHAVSIRLGVVARCCGARGRLIDQSLGAAVEVALDVADIGRREFGRGDVDAVVAFEIE